MRRLWACVAAWLEDTHARRTVMANARAKVWRCAYCGRHHWFPVAPPIPVEIAGPPTDFDG
jgi:hypothetical protein